MKENLVKKRVAAKLKAAGAYYFFPAANGYGRSGIPDIIVCHKGKFVGIECKQGNNKPTLLQYNEGNKIVLAGGQWIVVNEENLEENLRYVFSD